MDDFDDEDDYDDDELPGSSGEGEEQDDEGDEFTSAHAQQVTGPGPSPTEVTVCVRVECLFLREDRGPGVQSLTVTVPDHS